MSNRQEARGTEECCVFSGSVWLLRVGLKGDGQDQSVGLGRCWEHLDPHWERPGHPGPLCKMEHWWVDSDVPAMNSSEPQNEARARKRFLIEGRVFQTRLGCQLTAPPPPPVESTLPFAPLLSTLAHLRTGSSHHYLD